MKENLKRKKRHDKDKYYHLAKEQGYRSRAAFKLIQINRKYDFLSQAKVCLDLCAAPGGWCQVAAKHMPSGSIILGVDLLPIRPIAKVKTLVQDITTPECRAAVKREMRAHAHVDVVLCDGAPNVGAAYDKDAFVQNEIALAALRVATYHLGPGGTFLTKVYRSQDYNSLMWVFNQLFGSVQAIKPSSSRQQSAEIFVLCLQYKAPHAIDPKLLDPAYVFAELEGGSNEGKALNIFSSQYDRQKRHRSGYDGGVGVLLHKRGTVSAFLDSEDPVQMLSEQNQLTFEEEDTPFLEHKLTTEDIKINVADLKVLGKGDFKSLLKWRLKMREYRESLRDAGGEATKMTEEEERRAAAAAALVEEKRRKRSLSPEEEEEEIQAEIRNLQEQRAAKSKRERKKERERVARLRLRQAYGMHHDAFDLPDHDSIFSLKVIGDAAELERVRRGDYKEGGGRGEDVEGESDDDGSEDGEEEDSDGEAMDEDEEERRKAAKLEAELEESYQTYLQNKSDEKLKGTRAGKRKKVALAAMAAEKTSEDLAMYDGDMTGYVELLTGKRKGEDEESEEESDTESEVEEAEEAEEMVEAEDDDDVMDDGDVDDGEGGRLGQQHPLLIDPKVFEGMEKGGAKVARWFSNPVFESLVGGAGIGEDAEEKEVGEGGRKRRKRPAVHASDSEDEDQGKKEDEEGEEEEEEEDDEAKATAIKKATAAKAALATKEKKQTLVDEILASLPKTDKQVRHEKRAKGRERRERLAAKKLKLGDPEGEMEVDEQEMELVEAGGDPEKTERGNKRRELIRAGMGAVLTDSTGGGGGGPQKGLQASFEVVPAGGAPLSSLMPPVADDRKYDSENEEWDDEERARTLAIGTMMLRRSKAKELVDASYNRFAWNDAGDLPEWFVDDEERHYRPQIPIPKALMDEMKQRFQTLGSKPIAKVAEARARKKMRLVQRLKQAKNKASAIVGNPDMTERDKMKAIQKAVKGRGENFARPDKVYAVVRKGGSTQAKKGENSSSRTRVKLVDKRMKKDTRGMKKAMKNKKGRGGPGAKGGAKGGGKAGKRKR